MSEDPIVLVSPSGNEVVCGPNEVQSGKYVDLLALGYKKKAAAARKPSAVRAVEPKSEPKKDDE